MTAFEIFCYALAILTVLWLRAEPQVSTPIAGPPVQPVDDLPTLPELLAEAEALAARPVPSVAAAVAAPVAIARVEDAWIAELELEPRSPTAVADYLATMTSPALREECRKRGITWRNAHGPGKHLRKEEMLRALA
jgi:hypothetical protein